MDKQQEIEKLEKKRMEFLEVDNKRSAERIYKKIKALEQEIELEKLKDVKAELEKYKAFIRYKNMNTEFKDYCYEEIIMNCLKD